MVSHTKHKPYMPIKWQGTLAKKIPYPAKGSKDDKEILSYWMNSARTKLPNLFEAYGTEDKEFLFFYLAAQVVPGFRLGNNRGQPPKWKGQKEIALVTDVQEIAQRRKLSIISACSALCKNNPTYKSIPARTIERRYRATVKSLSPLVAALLGLKIKR